MNRRKDTGLHLHIFAQISPFFQQPAPEADNIYSVYVAAAVLHGVAGGHAGSLPGTQTGGHNPYAALDLPVTGDGAAGYQQV